MPNAHKQGEHVFNDFAGSVEAVFEAALRDQRLQHLLLNQRFGALRMQNLQGTGAGIARFGQDRVLTEGRTVVAPASGSVNDLNARKYGEAKLKLEQALANGALSCAAFLWKGKPRSNSSFREFETVVAGLREWKAYVAEAKTAFGGLIDAGYDPAAEKAALAEKVSDLELARRRTAIQSMKSHGRTLKEAGHDLIERFFAEFEREASRRISAP